MLPPPGEQSLRNGFQKISASWPLPHGGLIMEAFEVLGGAAVLFLEQLIEVGGVRVTHRIDAATARRAQSL